MNLNQMLTEDIGNYDFNICLMCMQIEETEIKKTVENRKKDGKHKNRQKKDKTQTKKRRQKERQTVLHR